MAAWCSMSGARTAAELATVLDSSQQVWGMALSATHGAGVRLVHWVALLNTCRALAKQ